MTTTRFAPGYSLWGSQSVAPTAIQRVVPFDAVMAALGDTPGTVWELATRTGLTVAQVSTVIYGHRGSIKIVGWAPTRSRRAVFGISDKPDVPFKPAPKEVPVRRTGAERLFEALQEGPKTRAELAEYLQVTDAYVRRLIIAQDDHLRLYSWRNINGKLVAVFALPRPSSIR